MSGLATLEQQEKLENIPSFIWSVADTLRGSFKAHEYGDIILPFTVLHRLDAILLPTKDAVLKASSGIVGKVPAGMLKAQANHHYSFYNTSKYTLETLRGDVENVEMNLRDYVNGFSENVRDIFEKYRFEDRIADLASHNLLMNVLQHFARVNLHPDELSNDGMGQVFEELIRKFAEASNETAGEHFTPREVIQLMVELLLATDTEALRGDGVIRSVYDPTAGTGGMLSAADDRLRQLNPNISVSLLGQEINPHSFAICKADMVAKGQDITSIANGDTLVDDFFRTRTFNYCLSNPPFGVDWKKVADKVTQEHESSGYAGRFGPGLPRVSDGSLLFLMHLISKMQEPKPSVDGSPVTPGGRAAIVLNGSPLFTGGAGSGESSIRKWVLDNDFLEAIIGLPTDMFYNTGISTYVWILAKEKAEHRRGKVQLIDGTKMFEKMRKSVGSKRHMLGEGDIETICRLYNSFEENAHSKIFDRDEFFYRTITVERPLQLSYTFAGRVQRALAARSLKKLSEEDLATLRDKLESLERVHAGEVWTNVTKFRAVLKPALVETMVDLKPAQVKGIISGFGEHDDTADVQKHKGEPLPDPDLRDTENVPWHEDINDYMEREVLPFVPDAWVDTSKTKDGCEIPFTRHFYKYIPPRPLEEIDRDLDEVLGRIKARLDKVKS